MKKITIAIDGYSSCGKSTMAKDLAREIGYIYIDSGAMTEEEAVELLLSFYRLMKETDSRDGRIVMGGLGRRNPENADRVSMAIMKAGLPRGRPRFCA